MMENKQNCYSRKVVFVNTGFALTLSTLGKKKKKKKSEIFVFYFIYLFFFSENRLWHFMQFGDNLHEMKKPIYCEKLP